MLIVVVVDGIEEEENDAEGVVDWLAESDIEGNAVTV
jgi:hypothetical protein